jgi:DNA-binding beta-propeller fold protein YncE
MSMQRYLGLMTLSCLFIWSTPSNASTQLLYVQEGHNLVTYRIDPATAAATKLGTMYMNASPNFPVQISYSGTFLYILGFTSAKQEYFWVHATAADGVPAKNPLQKLAVTPYLTQFFIHPDGSFAYAMYSWLIDGRHCATSPDFAYYASQIALYSIDSKTGSLTATGKQAANFPASCSQTTAYGLNSTGSKLYIDTYNNETDNNDNSFSYYSVNPRTGTLGAAVPFFNFNSGVQAFATTAISDNSIAMWNNGSDTLSQGIYVYSNAVNPRPLISCSASMSQVCTDSLNYPNPFQYDPSGKYLLINDASIDSVIIAAVDLKDNRLKETGASFPSANPSTVSFSPDGTLIYAINNYNSDDTQTVTIYVFDPSSGELLTKGDAIDSPVSVGTILPVSRP